MYQQDPIFVCVTFLLKDWISSYVEDITCTEWVWEFNREMNLLSQYQVSNQYLM